MSFCENKIRSFAAISMVVTLTMVSLVSCGGKTEVNVNERDTEAEKMLKGVWFNEDDNSIAFRAENDTIYYSDPTSMPMHYRIKGDTLYLDGSTVLAYPIEKQTEHLFIFKNNAGDNVRLVKTSDDELEEIFDDRQEVSAINQNVVVKNDTAFVFDNDRYHCYVQVNPTTYKLIKTSINNDGVTVENVYYDNIVHLSVYRLANQLFSKDFNKAFFKDYVPEDFYSQSILSDMMFLKCDKEGVHYNAVLYIPDSMTSFLVHVTISFDGGLKVNVNDGKMN